jgi:thiamine biosynthesis protein ThiS
MDGGELRHSRATTEEACLRTLNKYAYDVKSMENITLEINGEKRTVAPVSNMRELIEVLGINGTHVAVELNRKIIRRAEWEHTDVSDGDRIEIVQFVGGG